jgi:hypothetical protein
MKIMDRPPQFAPHGGRELVRRLFHSANKVKCSRTSGNQVMAAGLMV